MKGIIALALALGILCGVIGAQTIICDGHSCGGSGVVSCDGQLRDFVYRVTGGAVPPALDTVFIGTHDPNLAHYHSICLPTGWTYEIVPISRDDYSNPINHSVASPAPDGTCPYTFLFRNVTGAALSSTTATDFGFDYDGYPHTVDWRVAAFPPVSANWSSGVGTGAGPVHGPRCDTLCEVGYPLPLYSLGGNKDNFHTLDGSEPSSPTPALLAYMQTISGGADPYFDSPTNDRCFGHSFTELRVPGCVIAGQLCFRITPISEGNNDFFNIREDAVTPVWGPAIKYLKAWHSGNPADTFWNVGDTLEVCLDLANMPLMKRGSYYWPTNILATVQDGDLDFILSDDTKIDYLELNLVVCTDTCYATGDINGDGVSLNLSDLSALVGFVHNRILPAGPLYQCDLNGDDHVDQLDIDRLVCYLSQGISCFPVYPVPTDCDPDTVVGACCLTDTCFTLAEGNCSAADGLYQGDGSSCSTVMCPQWGACCLPDGSCVMEWEPGPNCVAAGGTFLGPNTTCMPNPCRCMRVPRRLVAWWPLDETAAPIAHDISGFGVHDTWDITASGTPGRSVAGMVGNAYRYDWNLLGISRTPSPTDPFVAVGPRDFTIDAWIDPDELTGPNSNRFLMAILSNEIAVPNQGNGTGIWFYLKQIALSSPVQYRLVLTMWQFGNSLARNFISDPFSLAPGFHHVAVTVKRTSIIPEVDLYLDGALNTSFVNPSSPPFLGKLFNTSPPRALDIGHIDPDDIGGKSPNLYFSGLIDEVQIFRRALPAKTIDSLWRWGAKGKCKDFCYVPPYAIMNINQTYPTQKVVVVNNDVNPRSYTWWVYGDNVDFTPKPPPSLVGVKLGSPAYAYPYVFPINQPLNAGQSRRFCVGFTNAATNEIFHCCGYIHSPVKIGDGTGNTKAAPTSRGTVRSYDVADLYVGDSVDVAFTVYNIADSDGVFDYEIAVQNSCDCGSGEVDSIISLNDLPPGTGVTGSIPLPLGDTATITVKTKLVDFEPFSVQTVALIADYDGTGELIPGLSAGIRPVFLPDCNGNGIHDTVDIASGFSADTNTNTIPDECEYYGSGAYILPGDANHDGKVNIGDAVYIINYVFRGGPAPTVMYEGDANGDCKINVGDAVFLVNFIFRGGPEPILNIECDW